MDEASGEPVEIWPDNLLAVNTFIAMSTQWRIGMSGPTGLDYTALPVVMQMLGVRQCDQAETFEGIRAMEDAALMILKKNK